MKPPIFEPVLSSPQAASIFSPPASIAAAQKGPSEEDANPNESDSTPPTNNGLETCVPRNNKSALRKMQLAGTMGLPVFFPKTLIPRKTSRGS